MIKIGRDTKIIQVVIVDGEPEMIKVLSTALGELKKKLPFNAEFFITNDKIRFRDVKWMIKELYDLYKLGEKKNVKD